MADALAHVGQLWTLGAFPHKLRPMVFAWPGSRDVCYFSAVRTTASTRVLDDFEIMLQNIRDAGVKSVHILGHSLGTQIFINLLRRGTDVFNDYFQVSTIVFLNPDAPLQEFVTSDYDILFKCCHHITIYADHLDGALWYSEFFNRNRQMQRIPTVGRRPFDLVRPTIDADNSIFLEDGPAQVQRRRSSSPLDLDVIEVSWMDHNMHGMRHSFFDINRFMVDDLCELFSTKRRASSRSPLLHRHTNVYSFMNAPRHIKHK